ncbi:hypothetical protein H6P81_014179 [Aristolochia fimbriata]|uniref:CCR4-NOT transcription complex subunit 4 n=1 Tax=Aristolochia fimbriata TaxID=158543 RepID=A0AAV7EK38_ARIFI|nr:hypothetical protein H6P81_014179 [Aristolochia fimbriata]
MSSVEEKKRGFKVSVVAITVDLEDLSMSTMSNEGERTCPLCMEEMDLTDQQLKPCRCGYQICVWCWHHVMEMAEKDGTEGRCPACRTPYDKEKIVGMTVNCDRLAELSLEKKQKSQKSKLKASESRKHLSTVRVIQRNLVYIVGLPANLADEEVLLRKEYFGQYGKILKVSISRTAGSNQHPSSNNSCSVYITFSKDEEAIRCIQVVNGFILDGRPLRACFGTTKYCHAWLRNMPCGNPDCLYLHDTGSQEVSYSKDEAYATCGSKLQHSTGSVVNNLQRRSGSFLPPPVDDIFVKSNNIVSAKPSAKPAVSITGNAKSSLSISDSAKSGSLPVAASWSSRVQSSKSSVNNAAVSPGMAVQNSTSANGFPMSSTVSATKSSILTPSNDKQDETGVAPVSNGRVETSSSLKPYSRKCSQTNLPEKQIVGFHEPTPIDTGATSETYHFLTCGDSSEMNTPPDISSNSNGSSQQFAVEVADHRIANEMAENVGTRVSALHVGDIARVGSSGSFSLITDENSVGPSETETKMTMDLLPNLVSTVAGTCGDRAMETVSETRSLALGVSLSPKRGGENLGREHVDYVSQNLKNLYDDGNIDRGHVDYLPQNLMNFGGEYVDYLAQNFKPLENVGIQKSSASDAYNVNKEAEKGENSIIEDILSLDLGMDDPSASPHNLAKILLGDNGTTSGYTRLFTPWKSCGSSESRFSFARMDECYPTNDDHAFSVNNYRGEQQVNGYLLEPREVKSTNSNQLANGGSIFNSLEFDSLNSHHHLPSTDISALPAASRPEMFQPLRFPSQRKAPSIPPPGFPSQTDRDQYFSGRPLSSFNSPHQFPGGSASLSSQQVTGSSYLDVEFIDPAIMAVGKGKVPLSDSHMISSNRGLDCYSEVDQRLQMLKLKQGSFNQHPLAVMDQSKYNLAQDVTLQEGMRASGGTWSSWDLPSRTAIESAFLARRGQSSLAEIVNNGRVGYDSQYGFLRPFSPHEDTKFQAPNSGGFFNSAFRF